jgi:hypothetical protein
MPIREKQTLRTHICVQVSAAYPFVLEVLEGIKINFSLFLEFPI